MQRIVVVKKRTVAYELLRKDVKNINLRIKADSQVIVSANKKVSISEIECALKANAESILETLDKNAERAKYAPKSKKYVNGETFRLFGHDTRLVLKTGTKNTVETDYQYIYLTVKDPGNFEQKKGTLEKWLNKNVRETVTEICIRYYPKFKKYDVEFPKLIFRTMVSRWGSCQNKSKTLTFNTALVEAPLACIEYVVIHEFTHFLEPNHSKSFYRKLSVFMPDWEERKKMLEG